MGKINVVSEYSDNMEEVRREPARPEVFNDRFQQLLNNDSYLKKQIEEYKALKGEANGVAELNADGVVPDDQLPIADDHLDAVSTKPVQNKVVHEEVSEINANLDQTDEVIFKLLIGMAQCLNMESVSLKSDMVTEINPGESYTDVPMGMMAIFIGHKLVALTLGYLSSRPCLDVLINRLPSNITIQGPNIGNDYKTTITNYSDSIVTTARIFT